jgi:hypothetical protein
VVLWFCQSTVYLLLALWDLPKMSWCHHRRRSKHLILGQSAVEVIKMVIISFMKSNSTPQLLTVIFFLVPIFDGQSGVDLSNLWKTTPALNRDIPSGSFAAVSFTVSCFKGHTSKLPNAHKSAALNVQFSVLLQGET